MQNSTKRTSKGESGEIINEYSLRKRLHMSWVPSPAKKKKKERRQASEDMRGRSDIRGKSRGRRWGVSLSGGIRFSRIVYREGFLCLLLARDVEVEVQAWIGISNLSLKGKPPRGSLSTGLIPQSRYNFVPLNDQSLLPMKVPSQPMALLGQAFHRADIFGSLATSSF